MENIVYKSKGFAEYYSTHRNKWNDLYVSEREIISRIFDRFKGPVSVLDVGCGCGGLAQALEERYTLSFYKGVDINEGNINFAIGSASNKIKCRNEFILGDISKIAEEQKFNTVISFSCVDNNVDTDGMIKKCWNLVREDGYFILSVRLTNENTVTDINKSYQWTNGGENDNEKFGYGVFNYSELFQKLSALPMANEIEGYGYWGSPSPYAVTPYKKVVFSVLSLKKGKTDKDVKAVLDMPSSLFWR